MKENIKQLFLEFSKKIDLKSILIIILFIISSIFFTKYMLEGSSNRKERRELEIENKKIIKEKKQLEKKFQNLVVEFKKDSLNLVKLQVEYERITNELDVVNEILKKKEKEIKDFIKKLDQTKKKIKELEENPPNRTGNELLESIKEKTK